MGTSLVTARPTTRVRPSARSIAWSPEVLSSLNTVEKYTPGSWERNRRSGERQREGPQHRGGLRLGLRVLASRDRVGDDPRSRVQHHAVALHHGAADRDRGIEAGRAPPDVADGAGVGPAPLRLEGVDDLHGPHLGRAGYGAGGGAGPEPGQAGVARPAHAAPPPPPGLPLRAAPRR